jgi:hypothetical protein
LRLPNFFIIGAPKAGTTALSEVLGQHPEIYMSPVKEPCFFGFEGKPPIFPPPAGTYFRRTAVWRPRDYAMLFARVTTERSIGEASPLYMMRPGVAARRIHDNLPQSRIIAVLRQPAERAHSDYWSLRMHGVEPIATFEEALAQEADRVKNGGLLGLYRKRGYYHAQLSVYYELFPRDRIRAYLYEDWRDNPRAMLRDICQSLEVDEGFAFENCSSNVTLLPRSRRLHSLAVEPGRICRVVPLLPAPARRAVGWALRGLDARFNVSRPPPLDPQTRTLLTAGYREDILRLQDLINRDLSPWLRGT